MRTTLFKTILAPFLNLFLILPRLVSASEALVSSDGSIEIDSPSVKITPIIYANNWSVRASSKPIENPFENFVLNVSPSQTIDGALHTQNLDNKTALISYSFISKANLQVDTLGVSMDFPINTFKGKSIFTDQKQLEFPINQPESPHVFMGALKHLAVGELAFKFARPTYVLVQDNRAWGGDSYSIRLLAPDTPPHVTPTMTFSLAFVLSSTTPLEVIKNLPISITPQADKWIPVAANLDIQPNSVLDFSSVLPVHTPAGKFGQLKAVSEHFEFESLPGQAQRFYGVNLCFTANYLSPEQAETLAQRLRRIGYNAIRIHHHDNGLVEGSADGTTLNSTQLEKLDALIAACIKHGIYVKTDLYISRSIPWKSIGIDKPGKIGMDEFKALCAVNDGAMQNWKNFVRQFLTHTNPHTGRTYAQEPALAWLSLINEGNLGNHLYLHKNIPGFLEKWSEWLDARAAKDPAYAKIPRTIPTSLYTLNAHQGAYAQFLSETEAKMVAEMKHFVKNELNCKALITNANGWTHLFTDQITHNNLHDFVDDHFYVDHPQWVNHHWRLPSKCPNSNPFKNDTLGAQRCTFNRLAGKPFTVSEFNFSSPGRYRGVGGIATGTLAALQDWSALWRFSYSHNREGMFKQEALNYFDVSRDPIALAAERAALCLFLRRDAQPLPNTINIVLPHTTATDFPKQGMPQIAPSWIDVAWSAKIKTSIDQPTPDAKVSFPAQNGFSFNSAKPAREFAATQKLGDGHVRIDSQTGTFIINTPSTMGGFIEKGTIQTPVLSATIRDVPASVWINALDAKPCASSSRILLTHVTDVQNTNIRYAERSRQTLLDWGKLPHLAERGRADIALKLNAPDQITVYRLSMSGERLAKVPTTLQDGILSFTADIALDPTTATFFYEICRR